MANIESTTQPAVVEEYDDGTQLESDGVVRTQCLYGLDSPTCKDPKCKTDRAAAALKIRGADASNEKDLKKINEKIAYCQKQVQGSQKALERSTALLQEHSNELEKWQARKTEVEAEREAKAEAARKAKEAKQAKAREVISEQIKSLSSERLIELLVEQGLDQIGPKQESARRILTEAGDTLRMSYWIKSQEFQTTDEWFNDPFGLPSDIKALPIKFTQSDAYDNLTGNTKYKAVTGMCSVGALAIARAMIDDAPAQNWTNLVMADRSSFIAAEALAWAIHQDYDEVDIMARASNCITSWNDNPDRTKDQVLETWDKALECPFLDLPEDGKLFRPDAPNIGVIEAATYGSEAAAIAAFDRMIIGAPQGKLERRVYARFGSYFTSDVPDSEKVRSLTPPAPRVALV